MTNAERQEVIKDLFALQKSDGGWELATLGNWKRSDGKEQDYKSSDGYGTGFTIYVLRCAGVSAEDPRIQKGIAWLKTHQRAQSAISSISWLVCQPKQFDLGESGSSPATDCPATNNQTTHTQEQG